MARSSMTRWSGAVAVAVLLLLSGCATDSASGGGTGQAAAPRHTSPAPGLLSPTPSPTPRAGRATAKPPAVPQYRATLAPVAQLRPAPARFAADSIRVQLPVVSTGVAADGQMQMPETNREVAWYAFGSRPGDPSGTTVMAAHIDTRVEGLGPFARLRELNPGDTIVVTDVDGGLHHYAVTSVHDVQKSDLAPDRLFRRDGAPALKVLTCGGPYSPQTGYRDNIVVTARPR